MSNYGRVKNISSKAKLIDEDRLTVNINAELLQRLKMIAIGKDIPFKELINQMLLSAEEFFK